MYVREKVKTAKTAKTAAKDAHTHTTLVLNEPLAPRALLRHPIT